MRGKYTRVPGDNFQLLNDAAGGETNTISQENGGLEWSRHVIKNKGIYQECHFELWHLKHSPMELQTLPDLVSYKGEPPRHNAAFLGRLGLAALDMASLADHSQYHLPLS